MGPGGMRGAVNNGGCDDDSGRDGDANSDDDDKNETSIEDNKDQENK